MCIAMTEDEQMMALMGFGGFDTTKDKAVAGNSVGAANVKKQRKFRQYMNRKGGFNRLLDKQ
ncbi:U4/U6.U5 small nuclear ribonucleoprotein [Coemansia nantahalensis]|nr:U4/U6.U5 small nuclear ribonucleoprotein [Coemansia nantahalensis]